MRKGLIVALIAAFCGCSESPDIAFSAANAWRHLTKYVETPNENIDEHRQSIREYICAELTESSVIFEIDGFIAETPHGEKEMANVIATIPSKYDGSEFVILSCHYDLKEMTPRMPGANDGGSGVAVLLELARVIKAPKRSVKIVFFDGEECIKEYSEQDGLYGSRHYAERLRKSDELKNCRAIINIDMVGDKELRFTLPVDTDNDLYRALKKASVKLKYDGTIGAFRGRILDDHAPFQRLGVPAINMIDFDYGKDNRFWHTPADSIENVSAESLETTGKLVLGLLHEIGVL